MKLGAELGIIRYMTDRFQMLSYHQRCGLLYWLEGIHKELSKKDKNK